MTTMEKRKFKLDRYTKKLESISSLKEIPLPENGNVGCAELDLKANIQRKL